MWNNSQAFSGKSKTNSDKSHLRLQNQKINPKQGTQYISWDTLSSESKGRKEKERGENSSLGIGFSVFLKEGLIHYQMNKDKQESANG